MILAALLSGCATAPQTSIDALADASRKARADHAEALVQDGGPRSLVTGQHLIAILDAGFAQ